MGHFNLPLLKSVLPQKYSRIDTVVETGTFLGEGTSVMAAHFRTVITIELSTTLYDLARTRLAGKHYGHVRFLNADSRNALRCVVNTLEQPAIFFLDAHWSGDASVDWKRSNWKGYGVNTAHSGVARKPSSKQQVPLEEEVAAIASTFRCYGVIYIDDADNFDESGRGLKNHNFVGEDWTALRLSKLKTLLRNRLRKWYQLDNQIIILFD